MQFPFKPKHIFHRFGGKVVEITGITHQTARPQGGRSQDAWWFTGRVQWDDTGKTTDSPIDQGRMCHETEEGREEIHQLSHVMMDYLRQHGEWFDEGKHKGWYAHRKERSAA